MKKPILAIFFVAYLILQAPFLGLTQENQYVVMLSLDGFRWDYTQKYNTPTLDSIASAGVKVKSLIPAFPSKTFPNHYTLATGLYPDHHGIVQNNFYDPATDRSYNLKNRAMVQDGSFYGGEPIWNTAEKQGVRSASYFWVGSEANIQGMRPSIWKEYKHDLPFEQRFDTVISWLSLPESHRPRLILFYFHEPDAVGHEYGPESENTRETVEKIDQMLGKFITRLKATGVFKQINFIIVSDHGMGPISNEKSVYLNKHLKAKWVNRYEGSNPVYFIEVNKPFENKVTKSLAKVEHIQFWKKGELPAHLHMNENPRLLDYIIVADSSWSLHKNNLNPYRGGGAHGYDPNNTDMHAIFIASGPAFKQAYLRNSFENVNVYNIICKVLNLNPAPNDGCLKCVADIFKE